METEKRYLTEKEVATITGFAVQTLRNDRFNRRGLPYVKKGKSVRYFMPDVYSFMESHKVECE